MTVRIKSQIWR